MFCLELLSSMNALESSFSTEMIALLILSAFDITCDIIVPNAEKRQLFLEWILAEM